MFTHDQLFNYKNNIIMKRYYRAILLALLIGVGACQQPTQEDSSQNEAYLAALEAFPKLLQRNAALQQGKEWENVQRYYSKYRTGILNQDQESYWKMAQVFAQEARVTGEHGHYYPSALKVLEELLAQEIESKDLEFRALTLKASIQLSQHEFQEALETGLTAFKMNPVNAQICGVLVDAYVELGDYPKAIDMADKMVSIRPDLRSYARIAYLREIYGMEEGAIEAMEMALASGYPGFEETAWTQLELGNLYQKIGNVARAKDHYREILTYRPDYPFAIAALADIAFQQKNYEEAEILLKSACEIIPEVGFYEQLAYVYQATNREEAYEETIEIILDMLADDVESGHNMNLEYANLYLDLIGDANKALAYAQEEYDKRPENLDTNRLLATIYKKQGKDQLAMTYENKIAQIMAKVPPVEEQS